MTDNLKKLAAALDQRQVKLNEPLARHTYFKIGGAADIFFPAADLASLKTAVNLAGKYQVPYFILGAGSNILVSDRGYRGLVIKNRADKIFFPGYLGKIENRRLSVSRAGVIAESGVLTNQLVRQSIAENLAGLEYFLGLPGTVGGAIYNNAHYQDKLIGSLVESVLVLDRRGREKTYQKKDLAFAYDYSRLQKTRETVLSVTFRLDDGRSSELWRQAEVFARERTQTQPLAEASVGCIFKNPAAPVSLGSSDKTTRSAGCLIEAAGLKGFAVDGAEVSRKHANFIINRGGATAAAVLSLAEIIQKQVANQFGVNLEMEIFRLGEF